MKINIKETQPKLPGLVGVPIYLHIVGTKSINSHILFSCFFFIPESIEGGKLIILHCYHGDSKPVDLFPADLSPVSSVLSAPWEAASLQVVNYSAGGCTSQPITT